MNALTKILRGGAGKTPGAAPSSSKSAPPADVARKKLTEAERVELLEVLRDSDLVASHVEGQAAALQETRARLVAEIEQARTEGTDQQAALLHELRIAEARTRKLEDQLRETSATEAQIRAEHERIGRVAERAIALRERQLEASADPALDMFRLQVEREQQITRNHSPAFEFGGQAHDADGNLIRRGGYSQSDQAALNRRSLVLRAVHRRLQQLKLFALSGEQLATELEELKGQIATVPACGSKRRMSTELGAPS